MDELDKIVEHIQKYAIVSTKEAYDKAIEIQRNRILDDFVKKFKI